MKPFSLVGSVIFGVIAVLHLLRLTLYQVDVVVGNLHIPLWISVAGFLVTAILSYGLWTESRNNH
jgi:hypothetical protein